MGTSQGEPLFCKNEQEFQEAGVHILNKRCQKSDVNNYLHIRSSFVSSFFSKSIKLILEVIKLTRNYIFSVHKKAEVCKLCNYLTGSSNWENFLTLPMNLDGSVT